MNVVNKHTHTPSPHDYYVGRGSALGNMYASRPGTSAEMQVSSREEAISLFEEWLNGTPSQEAADLLHKIGTAYQRGDEVNLVCFCAPKPCHGDVIKAYVEKNYRRGVFYSTKKDRLILQGKICPYCGNGTEYANSAEVYGKSYGRFIYLCRPCQAWVGTHKDDPEQAYGRLANQELRKWKQRAHISLDYHWEVGDMPRSLCYKIMSKHLGIPKKYCHIGYFDIYLCRQAVALFDRLAEPLPF